MARRRGWLTRATGQKLLRAATLLVLAGLPLHAQICYSFSDAQPGQPSTYNATVSISTIAPNASSAPNRYGATYTSVSQLAGVPGFNYSPQNTVTIASGSTVYTATFFTVAISYQNGVTIFEVNGSTISNNGSQGATFYIELDSRAGYNLFPNGQTATLPPASVWEGNEPDQSFGSVTAYYAGEIGGSVTSIGSACSIAAPTLVDPVPDLLSGPQITTAVRASDAATGQSYLADLSKGRIVQGLATDGVAQVVIRIPASSVGEQFTLTIEPNQCAGLSTADCTDQYGLLFDPASPPGNVFTDASDGSPTVTAVSTSAGPMAFAAYRAPVDFVRPGPAASDDQSAAQRLVQVGITSLQHGTKPDLFLTVVRPPVVLIHGTFSDPTVFYGFAPLQPWYIAPNSVFSIWTIAYNQNVDCYNGEPGSCVTSTYPSYPKARVLAPIRRNVIGIAFNAPLLLHDLVSTIGYFKSFTIPPLTIPVAAVQADVIAHSLGGLMARGMSRVGSEYTYQQIETFYEKATYGRGYIHKLITLGTPHLGTNLALRTVNGDRVPNDPTVGDLFPNIGGNDCTRNAAAIFGAYSLNSVILATGETFPGATFDQLGDPTQGILSPTLTTLNRSNGHAIPTALIAAKFELNNDSIVLDIYGNLARRACGTKTVFFPGTSVEFTELGVQPCEGAPCRIIPGDFLADNYSFKYWPLIFNGKMSDVVVPFTSATFGLPRLPGENIFAGVVHGPGSVGLGPPSDPHIGFNGPNMLDPLSDVSLAVVSLLNTTVTDASRFIMLP